MPRSLDDRRRHLEDLVVTPRRIEELTCPLRRRRNETNRQPVEIAPEPRAASRDRNLRHRGPIALPHPGGERRLDYSGQDPCFGVPTFRSGRPAGYQILRQKILRASIYLSGSTCAEKTGCAGQFPSSAVEMLSQQSSEASDDRGHAGMKYPV